MMDGVGTSIHSVHGMAPRVHQFLSITDFGLGLNAPRRCLKIIDNYRRAPILQNSQLRTQTRSRSCSYPGPDALDKRVYRHGAEVFATAQPYRHGPGSLLLIAHN